MNPPEEYAFQTEAERWDAADAGPDVPDGADGADAPDVADAADAADGADAADSVDAKDAVDVADAVDAVDTLDVADVPDAEDAADTLDVADVPDAEDTADTPDVGDVPDAEDAADTPDVGDVPDAEDAADVTDAADATDAVDAADLADVAADDAPDPADAAVDVDAAPDAADDADAPDVGTDAGAEVDGVDAADSADAAEAVDAQVTDPCVNLDCDDGNVCTLDTCSAASGCGHAAIVGATCGGDACHSAGACLGDGTCANLQPIDCADGNPCTDDLCSLADGCVHPTNDANACDLVCVVGDHCVAGSCVGSPQSCDDGEACTADSCNATSGACEFSALLSGDCDDGSACTVGDHCVQGKCAGSDTLGDTILGAGGSDTFSAVIALSDGGLAVCGSTTSKGAGGSDFWVVRLSPSGSVLWEKTFGGADADSANALAQTHDGGFVLAGTTHSKGAGGADMWLVRIDANGAPLWDATFGGAGDDAAYGVVAQADGGFALAGRTNSSGAGNDDFWLVRTDSRGKRQWDRSFGGAGTDRAYSIVGTPDGGFALAGATLSKGAGGSDFWLVRTDINGALLWDRTFGTSGSERANAVVRTTDGGFALAGYGGNPADFWLVATDAEGNLRWQRAYGGASNDYANALVEDAAHGFALVGTRGASALGGVDVSLVRVDHMGNLLEEQVLGSASDDFATGIARVNGQTLGLVGYRSSNGNDGWTLRLDAFGHATCATSGACFGVTLCDDGVACTADLCSAASGCVAAPWPVATPCGNALGCTSSAACTATGACVGELAADGSTCSDGDACTSDDACTGGQCLGVAVVCASGAMCSSAVGCVCEPGFWGSGAANAGCICAGTSTVVLAAAATEVCAYDWPVWGARPNVAVTLQANGDGTVSDSQTRLMWAQAASLSASLAAAATDCDALTLAGYDDWRVPTVAELESLVAYQTAPPLLNAAIFAPIATLQFWTSVARLANPADGNWGIDFGDATTSFASTDSSRAVRCVRSAGGGLPPATPRFTADVGNGIVVDAATGLAWIRDDIQATWGSVVDTATAQYACAALSLGPFATGWRVPTTHELSGLVDRAHFNPALDPVWPQVVEDVWSSDPAPGGAAYAVSLQDGETRLLPAGNMAFAKCVHD